MGISICCSLRVLKNISVAYFLAGAPGFVVIGFALPNLSSAYLALLYSCRLQKNQLMKSALAIKSCRSDYQQLVFNALSFKNCKIKVLKPCIMKPCELWSGKQVSTLSLHDF